MRFIIKFQYFFILFLSKIFFFLRKIFYLFFFNELFFKWTQESKIVKPFQEQVMNSADIEIPDYVTSEQNTNDIIIKVLKNCIELFKFNNMFFFSNFIIILDTLSVVSPLLSETTG